MQHIIDEIDIKILELLQMNSRIKRNVIAEKYKKEIAALYSIVP